MKSAAVGSPGAGVGKPRSDLQNGAINLKSNFM